MYTDLIIHKHLFMFAINSFNALESNISNNAAQGHRDY